MTTLLTSVVLAAALAVPGATPNPTASRVSRTFARMAASTPENPATVRILFYGQSIVAQDWGTMYVLPELRRRYPTVNFISENRAIGGYESPSLIQTAESDLYPFYPDLLFFHVYGPTDKYAEIVRRVRTRTTADIILWTSHLNRQEGASKEKIEGLVAKPDPRSVAIRETAEKYACMFVDLRTKWCRMLLGKNLLSGEMLIDGVHMKDSSLPVYANMLIEDLPWGAKHVPNPMAGTVTEAPRALKLSFTGNRVTAVSDGPSLAEYDVFLDGKPVASYGEMWAFTRASSGLTQSWKPMLHVVGRDKPSCERERWTLEFLPGFNAEGTYLPYRVTGSVTGPDGEGCNTKRFVSKSGRVVIEPGSWSGFGGKWGVWPYYKTKPYAGLRIEWDNVPLFASPYTPGMKNTETVLVQNCSNGPHTLELKPRRPTPMGIARFRIFAPAKK